MKPPEIVDPIADEQYQNEMRQIMQPADFARTLGDVDHHWRNTRCLIENEACSVRGKSVLELGCAFGTTAVVLAALGGEVTAIDVNERRVALARLNAQRYGLQQQINFKHVPDTTKMPFASGTYDLVSCNSVLEYVSPELLNPVLQEVDRLLRPGGLLFVGATSNRLWPREVHSGRWFANYLPGALDSFLPGDSPQRGLWPWQLRSRFPGYENVFLRDRGRIFLSAKAQAGSSNQHLQLLFVLNRMANLMGISLGELMPNICMLLRKP